MLRVRFAPSLTGYSHMGSARTFVCNWLLRIDDSDGNRNLQSDRLDRLELPPTTPHIFEKLAAYRDFASAHMEEKEKSHGEGPCSFNPGAREISEKERGRQAGAGEPFVPHFNVSREGQHTVEFQDAVYSPQSKSTPGIQDFTLLRRNGKPTCHIEPTSADNLLAPGLREMRLELGDRLGPIARLRGV